MSKRKHNIEEIEFMPEEIWYPIKGYDGLYSVSNTGRVKSEARRCTTKGRSHYLVRERIRKFSICNGYRMVALSKGGLKKMYLVHRLVAIAFIENNKSLPEINHKNGDKADNKVENLEWCTSSQNQLHAFSIGLQKPTIGEKSGRAKLKSSDIAIVKKLVNEGKSMYSVAKDFKVSNSTIASIVKNKSWKHLLKVV